MCTVCKDDGTVKLKVEFRGSVFSTLVACPNCFLGDIAAKGDNLSQLKAEVYQASTAN